MTVAPEEITSDSFDALLDEAETVTAHRSAGGTVIRLGVSIDQETQVELERAIPGTRSPVQCRLASRHRHTSPNHPYGTPHLRMARRLLLRGGEYAAGGSS